MRILTLLVLASLLMGWLRLEAAETPNIVLILADDQGWTGTSVPMDQSRGDSASDLYRTPHLERLAAQGMRFSNGYAPAPNCSPTRMSIQTGKTAARLGASDIIDVVPQGGDDFGSLFYNNFYVNKPLNVHLPISDLPDEELTIAELLKTQNLEYRTAHFGKWHMGGGSESLIWYYGAYRNNKHVAPQAAIRRGPHKLIWEFDSDRTILFDLNLDISETTDLSRFRPDVAQSMKKELRDYFDSVNAKLPTFNQDQEMQQTFSLVRKAWSVIDLAAHVPGESHMLHQFEGNTTSNMATHPPVSLQPFFPWQ